MEMEDFGSVWFYQESMDDLRQKLQYTTFELEAVKMVAEEEARKHKEEVNRLLSLLSTAQRERDEARDQLHKLITKLMPSVSCLNDFSNSNPVIIPGKANSSITESNSLSQSHNSSPVDSLFDAVSSPDFSNMNALDNSGFVNQPFSYNCNDRVAKIDPVDAVIEGLAKGKALPQKGKLLQAVMEAGPMLQTLLLAGPLPRWRNPPPVQPFRLPTTVSVRAPPTSSYLEAFPTAPTPRMCSASLLTFGSAHVPGAGTQIPVAKRQRFQ